MQQAPLDFGATEELFEPDAVTVQPGRSLDRYELFVALFPESEESKRTLAALSSRLRAQHRITGSYVPDNRLHTTLVKVAAYAPDAIPLSKMDSARVAAASVFMPPMRLTFNHVKGVPGGGYPLVLGYDGRSTAAIATLRKLLAQALRRVAHEPKHSTPSHMTLMYRAPELAGQMLEPVHWTATHFRLILSHVGLTHHQVIGRWPLGQQA